MKKILFLLLSACFSITCFAAPWDIRPSRKFTPSVESVTMWVDDYTGDDRLGISVHFVSGTVPVNTTWKVEIPTKVISDVHVMTPFPHTERKLITIIYECNVSYAAPGEVFYTLYHNEEFSTDVNGYVLSSEYYISQITQI